MTFAAGAEETSSPILLPPLSPQCDVPPVDIAAPAPLANVAAVLQAGNKVRILAIGSSSTAGIGVSSGGKTYPAQLEFILEFNSYIFEGVNIPEVKKLHENLGNIYVGYLPDFWTHRLDPVLPMAVRFYDILSRSDEFPKEFAIEKKATDLIFKGKTAQERLLFLGCFLADLRSWQAKVMVEQNRFPFMFEWQGRLKTIVDRCKEVKATQQTAR